MATNTHFATIARNAELNARLAFANGGTVAFYSGTQPANANTALSGNTLLAQLSLSATAFAAASGGVATANAITAAAATASGTATFFRIYESDGVTAVCDGSVGTASADCIVATTTFTSGVTIGVTSLTYTDPA